MVIVPAYAKLNLALEVVRRRSDGWHDLDSIVVRIDWHDLVRVGMRQATGHRLRLTGESAGVPDDDSNLALRAAAALTSQHERSPSFDIWLHKRVPAAAGLGGGSADAAAVLNAGAMLLRAAGVSVPADSLALIAAKLGSDVPALLRPGAHRVRGRGDVLAPIAVPQMHVVVVMTAASETRAAYAALHDVDIGSDGRVERLQHALARDVIDESLLGSALEAAACRATPSLEAALAALRSAFSSVHWHLTGSGGAAYALAPTRDHAEELVTSLRTAGYLAQSCRVLP